jgi:tRNA C32,U32 (ribose-2'-O)-methylase TrmJ
MQVEWEPFPEGEVNLHLNVTTALLYLQIRQQMEEQVAQKSSELEQYLQRVRELEDMYLKLQDALEDERQARQDEETVRKLQARYILLCRLRLCTLS